MVGQQRVNREETGRVGVSAVRLGARLSDEGHRFLLEHAEELLANATVSSSRRMGLGLRRGHEGGAIRRCRLTRRPAYIHLRYHGILHHDNRQIVATLFAARTRTG
jgi:hypothetical protein